MILQNSKGIEKEFKVLLEINKNNNKYIVYEASNNILHAGKLNGNILKTLNSDEISFINNILKDIKE